MFSHEPAGDIDLVDALISQITVPIRPDPVPVVVEFCPVQGQDLRRTAPEIMVESFGERLRAIDFSNRGAPLIAGAVSVLEFSKGRSLEPRCCCL